AYGVAAAGLTYFNKELHELEIEEVAYLAALPKAPSNYHPFNKTQAATIRRNWIIDEMAKNGFIKDEEAKTAKAKPLTVNIRPFGTRVYAADYFAEEVRRQLVGFYGDDGLYGRMERISSGDKRVNGGLSVRTTLDPKMQAMARKALVDGLVAFDRVHVGWRGALKNIDVSGDWGPVLGAIDVPSDITPWRLSVVLELQPKTAIVGLRPPKLQDGTFAPAIERHSVPLEEMKWAKVGAKKAEPKAPSEVLQVGDVIYVSPKDPANPAGVWSLMQIPEVGGGIVVMDPHTGRVLASVGGFSFAASQFDRAVQAKRQPGSSFKPFVYAAAIDNGYKPTSIVLDAPITIETGRGDEIWTPQNYGGKYYGPSTLRLGIEKSRNQMTVRLAQDMGMPLITEYARRFGIYDDLMPVLSMSLGAGETTLLKMTAAYAMLANGGRKVKPTFIDRIQDRWGRSIWRHDERECLGCKAERWTGQAEPDVPDDRPQIIDPHTAYQITAMMEGVIQRGTATILKSFISDKMGLAGKTGTTNDSRDVWFVGYSPNLVIGVFVGYDTPRPMGQIATGGAVAAPIFGNMMKYALADKPAVPFRRPPGLKMVWVNLKTGLPTAPRSPESVEEAFKPMEDPDEPHQVIGFTADAAAFGGEGATPPPVPPPTAGAPPAPGSPFTTTPRRPAGSPFW
ncbi:MAG TPA: penicillin-binding transpeptidase domain-containing protein, partial [Hyphomicrobiaceae bacterium]|nr:penicillin-binding transpeptidase domain-containing protein [Hyphomicrobiaceae bacterium]